MDAKLDAGVQSSGGVATKSSNTESLHATGVYHVTCIGADGKLKWEDTFQNLVTTQGKNHLLETYFEGTSYSSTWYLGLVDGTTTPTFSVNDTAAEINGTNGWDENDNYDEATRVAPNFNNASGGSKASTATAFSINASGTIAGCFLVSVSTKNATTGTLYSNGAFTGGDKIVADNDTLNVTYTASV